MTRAHLPDCVGEIRGLLVDARDVCRRLGLDEGAKPQTGGLLIRCPWHNERTPSCSARCAADGTLAVHCFGCDVGGDVFDLVAVAHGLDTRRDFPEVLRLAAELAGVASGGIGIVRGAPSPRPSSPSEPSYPPAAEVSGLWAACRPVGDVSEVAGWLNSRALDAAAVEDFDLARALPSGARLPCWAGCRGQTWGKAGYRLLLPMFNRLGVLRSLRARRVVAGEGPKNLAPAGCSTGGLVMADALGRKLLETGRRPESWPAAVPLRIVVAEGEPDFLTWGTRFSDADATAPAVLGVVSGGWTSGIASRLPDGARVIVRTHLDEPGERYARAVHDSLRGRCTLLRGGLRGAA